MNWNAEEIRALLPEQRLQEALGFDPHVKLSLDETVKAEDLIGYNTLISNWTYERNREDLLRRYFAHYHQEPEYWEKMGRPRIPQFLFRDHAGFPHEVIWFHVGIIKARELFLEDIVLANPRGEWRKPGLESQHYPGLGNGIFETVLSNLDAFAQRHGFAAIAAHLSSEDRIPIFTKYGYTVDRQHKMYPISKITKHQIPVKKMVNIRRQ